MSAQPEALRLADEYASDGWIAGTRQWCEEAAAELRRQHAEIDQLREQNTALDATCTKLDMVRDELLEHLEAEKSVCGEGVRRIAELTTQRDELLEALKRMRRWAEADQVNYTGDHPVAVAHAAIAKCQ